MFKFRDGATAKDIHDYLNDVTKPLDFRNPFQVCSYHAALNILFPTINSPFHIIAEPEKVLTRARKNFSPGTLFASIDQLMYPPAHLVGANRANVPGEPIYYCSNDPGTSIYEVRPQEGCWVTTLQIQFNVEEIELLTLGLNESKIKGYIDERDKGLHRFLEEHFSKEVESQETHLYYHTAIPVKNFLSRSKKMGIMYPSVGSNKEGYNIAINKEIIDNKKCWEFKLATVQEIISMTTRYDLVVKCLYEAKSIDKNGNFRWRPVLGCNGHKIDRSIYHT